MIKQPARRKRLLINPAFQASFAVYAIVATLLMVPLFIFANYYFFNLFAQKALALGLPENHELLLFAERQEVLMRFAFLIATVVAIAINVIGAYIFSNRIAGSMYRLTNEMNQVMDLKGANPIGYRKKDHFGEVYEAYNQMLVRLKG